jgi:Rrf2 family protein
MVELARSWGAGPRSLAEIAANEGLPLAYLEQIVADLRGAGLVVARRGRRGGYALARPPQEIRMGEVVRLLEGGISPMICIPADPAADDELLCAHQDYCTTRVLWLRVRDSIVATLESTTLADLVPARKMPDLTPARAALPTLPAGPAPDPFACHQPVAQPQR